MIALTKYLDPIAPLINNILIPNLHESIPSPVPE